jgi:hypothetical protein
MVTTTELVIGRTCPYWRWTCGAWLPRGPVTRQRSTRSRDSPLNSSLSGDWSSSSQGAIVYIHHHHFIGGGGGGCCGGCGGGGYPRLLICLYWWWRRQWWWWIYTMAPWLLDDQSPDRELRRRVTGPRGSQAPHVHRQYGHVRPWRKSLGGVSLSPRGTHRIFRFAGKRTGNVSPPFRQRQRTAILLLPKFNPTTPTPADCISCNASNGDIEERGHNFKI